MRSTYYPGVCTKPGTYLLSGLVYVHEVYTSVVVMVISNCNQL